jgi:putative AdoMet-dependent methyltransferase
MRQNAPLCNPGGAARLPGRDGWGLGGGYPAGVNHDAQAAGYDRVVADETHPIRTGYAACLDWVAAGVRPGERVLELGSGTGNLTFRLPRCRLVCVDLSAKMTEIARAKVTMPVEWVQADLLSYLEGPRGPFDAIVSTYAIHRLGDAGKLILFRRLRAALAPEGLARFGDLMFENAAERERLLAKHASDPSVADSIREECYWDLSSAVPALVSLGFAVETRRFSELSRGVEART